MHEPATEDTPQLPVWLSMAQVKAWVIYRSEWMVFAAGSYGSARRIPPQPEPVGDFRHLAEALQLGDLVVQGAKKGEEFADIDRTEWVRLPIAPLDRSRQYPYVEIMAFRDTVLHVFPRIDSGQDLISTDCQATGTGSRSTPAGEKESRAWLAEQLTADPGNLHPKKYFRDAALVKFAGRLSARGFDYRVWPVLAREHGRHRPGAKKKS